jgi:small conductance mechanosensitive channel
MFENFEFDITVVEQYITQYGLNIATALVVFIIGKFVVKILKSALNKGLLRAKVDKTVAGFVSNIVYGLALTFVIIASLGELGIETSSLAAIIAAAGLAVGLALQSSLSSFAAGVMIILFKFFKNGDFVEIAGTAGIVEDVHIFSTILKTGDNKTIIIPNASIISNNITNYSAKPTRRLDLVFGCGYDDDIKAVKKLLTKIVLADERILKEPEAVVAVLELADSSINFAVRPWVKTADYWSVKFDLNEKVKLEFDKAGFSIPYPQRDVHVHNEKA